MNQLPITSAALAEQSVLGSLMRFQDGFHSVAEILRSEDFSTSAHQAIFRAMDQQIRKSRPIDSISLLEVLGEKVGHSYLMELESSGYTRGALLDHARIVRDQSIRNKVSSYGQKLQSTANEASDVSELIAEASRDLSQVTSRLQRANKPISYADLFDDYLLEFESRALKGDGITGLRTGISELDELTSGLHPENLVILAARPSMGKTALAMNIVDSACLAGHRVLVFSMEMSKNDLIQRSLSSIGRINQDSLKRGQMDEQEFARMRDAAPLLKKMDILIDDNASHSMASLSARAHEAHREAPLSLIVVDYLQLMEISSKGNRTEGVGEISRGLKTLAKDLGVPIIALSQLNRDLERRPNKRPVNSDLRDSGSIEQDADLVLFVYRDEVYEEDSPDKGFAELIIGKQRNGPLGTVRTRFVGEQTRFESIDREAPFARAMERAAESGILKPNKPHAEGAPKTQDQQQGSRLDEGLPF